MVTRADFQGIAADIKTTFSDFFLPRVFTLPGAVDPITEQETGGATETVDAVREEYQARQIDGQAIQSRDFKLLALVNNFTEINPKTDGLKVNVDGVDCQVVRAEKDAADAVWIIQVRGL
ncbi:MAG: hypothetical protein CL578_22400 [Alteromonadaceae bacterium]|jgi:hypothetical protein|uniref:hypothetical protein n=1 Tax=unclassified Methylophaga TaxID=2629249 RepID=UPI000C38B8B2|nr:MULTISPECIES: hypothetical protein [unclassified Methylophaga]MBN27779.1 hypothetical protein [Alteromonadaceae bacterium]MAP27787.1 hypothetical protein [Methylophaga sp.]HAD31527.1 hypothetical protein [Methylophaga sp.]HBX59822.1 hypothetical protein [Methylophaga sp.]HCN99399.1 hypothetical protein [Methylophaga sp.]|tara:strand:- start:22349 stop:22708 length:360 start_codon:yes stop_codon:yes gene_type:complete